MLTVAWKLKSSSAAASLITKRMRLGVVREWPGRVSFLSIQNESLCDDLCFSLNAVEKASTSC